MCLRKNVSSVCAVKFWRDAGDKRNENAEKGMRLDYQTHPTDRVRETDSCCSWDDVTSNAAKETVL